MRIDFPGIVSTGDDRTLSAVALNRLESAAFGIATAKSAVKRGNGPEAADALRDVFKSARAVTRLARRLKEVR